MVVFGFRGNQGFVKIEKGADGKDHEHDGEAVSGHAGHGGLLFWIAFCEYTVHKVLAMDWIDAGEGALRWDRTK